MINKKKSYFLCGSSKFSFVSSSPFLTCFGIMKDVINLSRFNFRKYSVYKHTQTKYHTLRKKLGNINHLNSPIRFFKNKCRCKFLMNDVKSPEMSDLKKTNYVKHFKPPYWTRILFFRNKCRFVICHPRKHNS